MNAVTLTAEDQVRVAEISRLVPGYSSGTHYAFFKGLMKENLWIRDMLILGVYQARDMAFILDCAIRYRPFLSLVLLGVDKFTDAACEDWPDEKKGLNWQDAGFGEAPSSQRAAENLHRLFPVLPPTIKQTILVSDDAACLASFAELGKRFDAVYLDTSHDYATVARQIEQVKGLLRDPHSIIAGDDFSDQGLWGVKTAVNNSIAEYEIFGNWIWVSSRDKIK